MIHAENDFSCIPTEARPTGGKLEIPELGIGILVDSAELSVSQEFPTDDGQQFFEIVEGLTNLAAEHFQPNGIHSNGFAHESFMPMGSISAALKESLELGGDFHSDLSKAIGMPAAFKTLDYNFISGKLELHFTLSPVTFEKRTSTKYAAGLRASQTQQKNVERKNVKSVRANLATDHALLLMSDLIESDPPDGSLPVHFQKLMNMDRALKASRFKPLVKK
jgi:hypothetical protein